MESVDRLCGDASVERRIETANSVGSSFAAGELGPTEFEVASAILERLAQDAVLKVRQAVCDQLLHCPFLPSSIARIMAQDVESISIPFIRRSKVLSEDDLLDVVRDGDTLAQASVAKRATVSPAVADELVGTGKKTVVKTVLANETAEISETALCDVVETFGEVSSVQSLLVDRQELPTTVTQRLVTRVSDSLAERLVEQHHLPPESIADLFAQKRESALSRAMGASSKDVKSLARSVERVGTLTPTFVLRALCVGQFGLFVTLMASLAGISTGNARVLINDQGQDGFRALYRQSGLPDQLFASFRAALNVALEVRRKGLAKWNAASTRKAVKVLAQANELATPIKLDALLEELSARLPEDERTIGGVKWM